MNSDYGNYSRDLAKVREEFSNKSDSLKKSYDQSLKSVTDTHEQREKDNKILNEERLKDILDQNQEELVSLNEKSAQTLNNKQKEFMNTLRENSEVFNHEKKTTKEQLENKLVRAKESFTDSLKQVKESNDIQNKEKDKNFTGTLTLNRNNSEQKIQEIGKNTQAAFADYTNDVTKQKKEVNQKHATEQAEQYKRMRGETQKKIENFNNKLSEVNKTHNKEKEHLMQKDAQTALIHKKDALENLENVENSYRNRNQEIVNDFQNKFAKLEDQVIENAEKQKNQIQEERENKLKLKEGDLGKNTQNSDVDDQKLATKENYERRLGTLKKQMSEQNQFFTRRSTEANNEALGKLKTYENDAKDRIASNDKEHHNDFERLKLTSRKNSDQNVSEYNKKLETVHKETELKIDKEKALSKEMLSRKQVVHNKEQRQIEDINLKNLEYIKNEAQKERTALKTNAIKDLNENVFVVKQHYQKKFDKTLEGYQQKFDEQGKLIEKIQEGTNDIISDIAQKSEKKVDIVIERSKAEREIEKNEFLDRYNQLKDAYEDKFKAQKKEFDRELARTRKENNMIVTGLAKKNNEEVKNLMESHSRDMKRASDELRKEKDHNFRMSNAEKENLVERYENKIEELKVAYENDKVKLSENKRSERA